MKERTDYDIKFPSVFRIMKFKILRFRSRFHVTFKTN